MSSLVDAPHLSDRMVIGTFDAREQSPQSFEYATPKPWAAPGYELFTTRWARPVVERLEELTRLPRNWDSYGGVAVTSASASEALWFLARLLEPGSIAPWVVPLSDGGVQLEWHTGNLDVEVVFSPEQGDEVSIVDSANGMEWAGEPEAALRENTFQPLLGNLRIE